MGELIMLEQQLSKAGLKKEQTLQRQRNDRINTHLSTTAHINDLNFPIKGQKIKYWIKTQEPCIFCL